MQLNRLVQHLLLLTALKLAAAQPSSGVGPPGTAPSNVCSTADMDSLNVCQRKGPPMLNSNEPSSGSASSNSRGSFSILGLPKNLSNEQAKLEVQRACSNLTDVKQCMLAAQVGQVCRQSGLFAQTLSLIDAMLNVVCSADSQRYVSEHYRCLNDLDAAGAFEAQAKACQSNQSLSSLLVQLQPPSLAAGPPDLSSAAMKKFSYCMGKLTSECMSPVASKCGGQQGTQFFARLQQAMLSYVSNETFDCTVNLTSSGTISSGIHVAVSNDSTSGQPLPPGQSTSGCAETDANPYNQCTLKIPEIDHVPYIRALQGGNQLRNSQTQTPPNASAAEVTALLGQQLCPMYDEFKQCVSNIHSQLNSGCAYPLAISQLQLVNSKMQPALCTDIKTHADSSQCMVALKSNGSMERLRDSCQSEPKVLRYLQESSLSAINSNASDPRNQAAQRAAQICGYAMVAECQYEAAGRQCGSSLAGKLFKDIDIALFFASSQIADSFDSFRCQSYSNSSTAAPTPAAATSAASSSTKAALPNETKLKEKEEEKANAEAKKLATRLTTSAATLSVAFLTFCYFCLPIQMQ